MRTFAVWISVIIFQLNWTRFFDIVLPKDVRSAVNMGTVVIMSETKVLQKLTTLLRNTSKR